ncbi:UDP-galactose transporter [Ascosphaera acerosa]|nr:UDP-galactose transporter [Ascosphaera acerosa]
MARIKQAQPLQRTPSALHDPLAEQSRGRGKRTGESEADADGGHLLSAPKAQPQPRLILACFPLPLPPLATSYAFVMRPVADSVILPPSSLSWGVLQEAITTTAYAPSGERWSFPVVLNTVQSTCAALTGLVYLLLTAPRSASGGARMARPFPSRAILAPLCLVAVTSSLASPFGYASLAHIDYLTFVLAKSCKLLPVMLLHLTVFRKRYPLYKYAVIALVTLGVATFTLHHPSAAAKARAGGASAGAALPSSSTWGLFLLAVNLLLDGLTNTTQDHIFSSPHLYGRFTGPQMMVAVNTLSTLLTATHLLVSPALVRHCHLLSSLCPLSAIAAGASDSSDRADELSAALAFLSRNPAAARHVLAFAVCGAVGQLFIFYTLAHYSSLVLVTVTVTRKMLTMVLSVVWFGHRLTPGQWLGVGLVFGGIGAEAVVQRREKAKKASQVARKVV